MKNTLYTSALLLPALVFSTTVHATGMHGPDFTVFADGTPQTLNASGHSGSSGRDGNDGADQYYCAVGGDGESGESGESGGNAGKITIFYDDISKLQALTLYQLVGQGGWGGRGGRGGRGGGCESVDDKGHVTYYQASNGNDGSRGWDGSDGHHGGIWLIPNLRTLGNDDYVVEEPLSVLTAPKTYALSKHMWNFNTSGAGKLFSKQSRLGNDSYSLYQGTNETQVEVIWNAPVSADHFMNKKFSLSYDGQKVSLGLGYYDVWSKITQTDSQIQIDQLLLVSEVKALKLGKLTGNGTGITLAVDDAAKITPQLTDEMTIEYRTPNGMGQYIGRYTGVVPANAITARADGSGYDIAVGMLKIGSGFLKAGTKVQIKLYVTRSAFGNTLKLPMLNQKYMVQ